MHPITLPVLMAPPMRRGWRVALAFAALSLAIGCGDTAESPAAQPLPQWHYWKSAQPNFGMDYRVAQVSAREGWIGRESEAPSAALYTERFANGSLRVVIQLAGQNLAPACPQRGCYVYARSPGEAWTVLRAEPASDDGAFLTLSAPWSLQALIDTAPVLELDLPLAAGRRCVYTFTTAGYRVDLHDGAGLEEIDGLGEVLPPWPDDDPLGDITQQAPEDWVTWPACTTAAPTR
jgi:hypothetical protein